MSTKPRILVVDDEENIRFALNRWFEMSGFEVDTAEDGAVAVEKCRTGRYDVITMDLVMPKMDGPSAIGAIREANPDVPILVLSGFPDRVVDAPALGATKILAKPVLLSELEQEVRALLKN
ncbi:MAG: response regulator [Candidatus Hydrogenedentes bacterium]|nr:response regulator [Candidatus Hydrogenedentota bacterium]